MENICEVIKKMTKEDFLMYVDGGYFEYKGKRFICPSDCNLEGYIAKCSDYSEVCNECWESFYEFLISR